MNKKSHQKVMQALWISILVQTVSCLMMDAVIPQTVVVLLDGKPLPKEYRTADMDEERVLLVKEPRKYDVLKLKGDYGRHNLTLVIPEGVSAYAFTFGN